MHHQRWFCYETATNKLLKVQVALECGPALQGREINSVKDETADIQGQLYKLVPELSSEATVFHPSWVRKSSVTYSNNNAYLIIEWTQD